MKDISDCEYHGCAWSVIRVYTVSAVSNNTLLTEVDVKCHRCKAQRYVVSTGNVLEDGEVINTANLRRGKHHENK